MKVKLLTPEQWDRHGERLIGLMKRWGGSRLTVSGIAALESLRPGDLFPLHQGDHPDAAIAVVMVNGGIAGAAFARQAGRGACLVAGSPSLRGRGAGSLLLRELQKQWGHLTCQVAAENTASLKMCFHAGFRATSL